MVGAVELLHDVVVGQPHGPQVEVPAWAEAESVALFPNKEVGQCHFSALAAEELPAHLPEVSLHGLGVVSSGDDVPEVPAAEDKVEPGDQVVRLVGVDASEELPEFVGVPGRVEDGVRAARGIAWIENNVLLLLGVRRHTVTHGGVIRPSDDGNLGDCPGWTVVTSVVVIALRGSILFY